MSVFVVETKLNGNSGVVTLQSDNPKHAEAIDELQNMESRRLAISEASRNGLGVASINGWALTPYPITKEGVPMEDPTTQSLGGYRIDIPVTAGRV